MILRAVLHTIIWKAALRLYDRAEETYQMLGRHPETGELYPSTKPALSGIRFFPIKGLSRCLSFYKPAPDGVGEGAVFEATDSVDIEAV